MSTSPALSPPPPSSTTPPPPPPPTTLPITAPTTTTTTALSGEEVGEGRKCPSCQSFNLEKFNIHFNSAFVMCPDINCGFPFNSPDLTAYITTTTTTEGMCSSTSLPQHITVEVAPSSKVKTPVISSLEQVNEILFGPPPPCE